MKNQAAWLTEAKAKPLKVGDAEYYTPGADEVLIKNSALGINPVDWSIIYEKFPNVIGTDVAGEIVEVGKDVTHLKKGQRVIGHCVGLMTNDPKDGAFQLYSICKESNVAPIPDSLSFERATVLPLALSTAACGLYQENLLGLPLPAKGTKPNGKMLLVYGGSSSVGTVAIQLAIGSGFDVVSTASKHNLEYVKSLGAKAVVDHHSTNLVDQLVQALEGGTFAGGFDSICTDDTLKTCVEVAERFGGGKLALTKPGAGGDMGKNVTGSSMYAATIAVQSPAVAEGVWGKWVPGALADGTLQAKPDPIVIEGGLAKCQEAVDRHKQGVSAAKVVVKL
ncbi:oxidoreductase-like protein [Rhizodiscina lignyota]|uniref:Oxidoreductase-like protein n=1 Tax=Rhizodiscina lignyota TaxID=1504668 RepID=A0A9P4ILT8_9PEZI|nr:oxidoreductase-like protein [Rhizodiscina lignyota]